MATFRITENRLFAPALLETDNGDDALNFIYKQTECRVYRDNVNVAIIIIENGYIYVRCDRDEYKTLADIFNTSTAEATA